MNKIFIIYFGFFLAACNYQVKDKSPEAQSEIPDTFSAHQITYQLVLEKVLTAKCLNCHSAAGGNRGQLNLEGYQNIFNKRDLIRDEVAGHSMPKTPTTPLTAAQLDLIIRWIDFGAQEFASPEPKVPIIPEPKVPIIPEPKVPTRPEPQVPIIPGPIPPEVGIPLPRRFS